MTARALLREVDWSDERLEGPLLRLATIVAAKAAQLDNAVTWFDELKAISGVDASAAVQVSGALEGGRDLDAALAFLDPLLDERPLDPELLAQVVHLLVKNDQTERAVEYLRQASSQPGADGTGSSLLLARLYLEVGLEEEARLAYQAAL